MCSHSQFNYGCLDCNRAQYRSYTQLGSDLISDGPMFISSLMCSKNFHLFHNNENTCLCQKKNTLSKEPEFEKTPTLQDLNKLETKIKELELLVAEIRAQVTRVSKKVINE